MTQCEEVLLRDEERGRKVPLRERLRMGEESEPVKIKMNGHFADVTHVTWQLHGSH